MTNQKDIAKKQAEIVGQLQQFPIGRTNSGGRAGGMVEVVVTNPLPGQPRVVQAKCANDCPPGEVQLLRADDGSYVALSRSAAQKTSETTTRQVSRKNPTITPKKKKEENIKILFYVNLETSIFPTSVIPVSSGGLPEKLWKELWIGGTWPAKKIYTVPPGYRLVDAFIVNTGENEEDYVVMGRLFPVNKLHLFLSLFGPSNPTQLGSPAAIFFIIEKGVLSSQEFAQESCPPYFWRYCGGGFFYSGGSGTGAIFRRPSGGTYYYDYHLYNKWNYNLFRSGYNEEPKSSAARGDFVNFSLYPVGISNPVLENPLQVSFVKPGSHYSPIFINTETEQAIYNGQILIQFGLDISSSWYFKDKVINIQNINTFYAPQIKFSGGTPALSDRYGLSGSLCVTPRKSFDVDYEHTYTAYQSINANAIFTQKGYLYEPLIVNNTGNTTLALKQYAEARFSEEIPKFLMSLSNEGESVVFTQITGIPEVNNYNTLGRKLTVNSTTIYDTKPFTGQKPSVEINSNSVYTLKIYWFTGNVNLYDSSTTRGYSLSSNQSESNKEILFLKDFVLAFARLTNLNVLSSEDIRKPLYDAFFIRAQSASYLKPLSSFIGNSIYIPYGFIDENKLFFEASGDDYSNPEKTRILPKTSKATAKVVELTLDEITGKVNVEPNVKSLPIYMVTPENTGFQVVAFVSANYWCKEKNKGQPMPTFTPTLSETPAPAPTPAPTPSPTPAPTPAPTPTPGGGGYIY